MSISPPFMYLNESDDEISLRFWPKENNHVWSINCLTQVNFCHMRDGQFLHAGKIHAFLMHKFNLFTGS